MCNARYIGPERAAIEAAEARFAATLQPLTAAEARAAAVSEGLELVLSSNSETGFKGVYRKQSGKYPVTIHENGSMRYLGIFATAEEAALRYARYVGAARAAIEAAEAGITATRMIPTVVGHSPDDSVLTPPGGWLECRVPLHPCQELNVVAALPTVQVA